MIINNMCDDCKKTPVDESDIGFKGNVLLLCKQCAGEYAIIQDYSDGVMQMQHIKKL